MGDGLGGGWGVGVVRGAGRADEDWGAEIANQMLIDEMSVENSLR